MRAWMKRPWQGAEWRAIGGGEQNGMCTCQHQRRCASKACAAMIAGTEAHGPWPRPTCHVGAQKQMRKYQICAICYCICSQM